VSFLRKFVGGVFDCMITQALKDLLYQFIFLFFRAEHQRCAKEEQAGDRENRKNDSRSKTRCDSDDVDEDLAMDDDSIMGMGTIERHARHIRQDQRNRRWKHRKLREVHANRRLTVIQPETMSVSSLP
jgi:hypothetical protein